MAKRHMKRQTAPTTWKVDRKGSKFITRPAPGKSYELSMPLSLIFKNLLKYCKTTKEVKSILQDKEVLVGGKRRKDPRYSVGVMEVISMPVAKENFRMLLDRKGKLSLVSIDDKDAKLKPAKIMSKKTLKNGKVQLNFFEGKNLLTEEAGKYSVGQVLIMGDEGKILSVHAVEKGSFVLLVGGKNLGERGTIESIEGKIIKVKNPEGGEILTDKRFAFVLGKDKPEIKVAD